MRSSYSRRMVRPEKKAMAEARVQAEFRGRVRMIGVIRASSRSKRRNRRPRR